MFQTYEQMDNNHNLIHNNTKQLKKVTEQNNHKDMSRYGSNSPPWRTRHINSNSNIVE